MLEENKMTELKTLKDLESFCNNKLVEIDELRAEAVRWVKARGQCEASDVLIDFFNLTSEDLK